MKAGFLLIFVATIAVFLVTFLVSSGLPTGFFALEQSESLNLRTGNIEVYDTKAVIRWTTSTEAFSTLSINDEQIAFPAAKEFSKEILSLKPGTGYEYKIRACDRSVCQEKSSVIVTKTSPMSRTSPITGAVVGIDGVVYALKASANLVLYALIAMVSLMVIGRIGHERWNNRDKMPGMIKNAQKLIDHEQQEEAYEIYSKARQAFSELEEEAKLKHYNDLQKIYHSLKRHADMKEAQQLAEKYTEGTITRDELERLNDLLASQ